MLREEGAIRGHDICLSPIPQLWVGVVRSHLLNVKTSEGNIYIDTSQTENYFFLDWGIFVLSYSMLVL